MLSHALKAAFASARRALGIARSSLWRMALPGRCALCGNLSQHQVCGACDTISATNSAQRCPCCAATVDFATVNFGAVDCAAVNFAASRVQVCGACLAAPPDFDATLVLADYAAPFDALAQILKFSGQAGLARWFAGKLAQRALAAGIRPDLIVPVPLSAQRLALRGYNQSWEIARPLARHLHTKTACTYLRRLRDTAPQTNLADARQRRHNVRGAFAVRTLTGPPAGLGDRLGKRLYGGLGDHLGKRSGNSLGDGLSGMHVAVVDDVMTSGATLAEIARVLKRAGAARVTNLVALRTPSPSHARAGGVDRRRAP
jgi:predicted amidophosphoribosyltransferase